jgi:hypothetical protein
MVELSPNTKVLHADAEHPGIRTVIMLSLIVVLVLAYLLMRAVFQAIINDSPLLLVCGTALPIGLAVVWLLEVGLKRIWPSGRSITITDYGLKAANRVQNDMQLKWGEDLQVIAWTFSLGGYPRGGRERRIQASWHCLAIQLQQNERYLVAYAYFAPKKAEHILGNTAVSTPFNQLDPKDVYKTSVRSRYFSAPTRPDIPAKVLAGKNGRYWLAEKRRWKEGYELSMQDFETFLKTIEEKRQHFSISAH